MRAFETEKTEIAEVDRSVYDIKDKVNAAFEVNSGLTAEIVEKIESVGMLESIPLWIVTLLGSLLITVLSFIMILTVYGRMFKLYMYTAIAPIPISTFAGEPSQSVGKNFIKSYAGCVWKGRSLHWPASFFPSILPVRRPLGIRS